MSNPTILTKLKKTMTPTDKLKRILCTISYLFFDI